MSRIHIIGRKNSGKTTLICALVTEFNRRGLRIGTIKHTHHHHELDTPGKDSHRHREAGSTAVGILSPHMNAIFRPKPVETVSTKSSSANRYQMFESLMSDCDIVLVEGDSSTAAIKIEVYRSATGEAPLAATDRSILAVVTNDVVDVDALIWPLFKPEIIADEIERLTKAL